MNELQESGDFISFAGCLVPNMQPTKVTNDRRAAQNPKETFLTFPKDLAVRPTLSSHQPGLPLLGP